MTLIKWINQVGQILLCMNTLMNKDYPALLK